MLRIRIGGYHYAVQDPSERDVLLTYEELWSFSNTARSIFRIEEDEELLITVSRRKIDREKDVDS